MYRECCVVSWLRVASSCTLHGRQRGELKLGELSPHNVGGQCSCIDWHLIHFEFLQTPHAVHTPESTDDDWDDCMIIWSYA